MIRFLAQQDPIIVKIVETPEDPTGLAGVLLNALGITGFLIALAVALGLVLAAVLFLKRSRHPLG